jgi:hypothetical protein
MSTRNASNAIFGNRGTLLSLLVYVAYIHMAIFNASIHWREDYCCLSQVLCVFVHISQRMMCCCCSSLANVNYAKQQPSQDHIHVQT